MIVAGSHSARGEPDRRLCISQIQLRSAPPLGEPPGMPHYAGGKHSEMPHYTGGKHSQMSHYAGGKHSQMPYYVGEKHSQMSHCHQTEKKTIFKFIYNTKRLKFCKLSGFIDPITLAAQVEDN